MNHIAIVRSSARMAQQKASAAEAESREPSIALDQSVDQTINELSQMSIISLGSLDGGDVNHGRRKSQTSASISGESSTRVTKGKPVIPKPVIVPLEPLENISDIEACVDDDLSQLNALKNFEEGWKAMASNLSNVMNHLQDCSNQVTEASLACLEALVESIDLTCDKADDEMKALYHLITKCDELTTKLSAASSFCGEIKTLRKSIETLENLYRSRPHFRQTMNP